MGIHALGSRGEGMFADMVCHRIDEQTSGGISLGIFIALTVIALLRGYSYRVFFFAHRWLTPLAVIFLVLHTCVCVVIYLKS